MSEAIVEIEFFDTTLRDGAQSLPAKRQFHEGHKPLIADAIAAMGVNVIEAGFPVTPGDFEEVRAVAQTVGNRQYPVEGWRDARSLGKSLVYPEIAGLSRCVPADIETTWLAVKDANRPRIHTFVSADPEHMAVKFPDKSPDEVLEMGRSAVSLAKELTSVHPSARVEFSAEAASTTDLDYLEKVVKTALDEGADVINVPDTVGQRTPFWMEQFYAKVIAWTMQTNPEVVVSSHNHNDLGNAAINSVALVEAATAYADQNGVKVRTQIESTICGLGERAGNADIFPIVASLFKFSGEGQFDTPITWQFNPSQSVWTAKTVMAETRTRLERFVDFWHRSPRDMVDRQNPIVGRDVLTHRAGIHSDGVIKGGWSMYTPTNLKFWGHEVDARHEEGKYQGVKGRAAARASRRFDFNPKSR